MGYSDCPNSKTMKQYAEGRLEANHASELQQHFENCARCSELLQKLESALPEQQPDRNADTVALRDQVRSDSPDGFQIQNTPYTSNDQTVRGTKKRAPVLAEGQLLGKYRILKLIGKGGMGEVFQARHEKLDRTVALKTLTKAQMAQPESMERFEREMKAVARLDHPNIVRAYDADETEGVHYFVMEYLEGTSLARILKNEGPLAVARACTLAQQVAVGLVHIHRHNLIHRDIKPANLIVTPDGTVKILDLGLALLIDRSLRPSDLTESGLVIGTPDFMASEQLEDMRSVDIRADIYSLGATLYAMLVGHGPFAGNSYQSTLKKIAAMVTEDVPPITDHRQDIPVGLVSVLERMLQREPDDRYQTPEEIVDALQPFVNDQADHRFARSAGIEKSRGWAFSFAAVGFIALAAFVWHLVADNRVQPIVSQPPGDIQPKPPEPLVPRFELSDPLPELKSHADLIAAALADGSSDVALSYLQAGPDNSLRSYLILALANRFSSVDRMLELIDSAPQPGVRSALLLSLAESEIVVDPAQAQHVLELYQSDRNGGVHAAARLLLQRKGFAAEVAAADEVLRQAPLPSDGWYQSLTGHTMVIVPGPTSMFLGSSKDEVGRFVADPLQDESHREITIEYPFAVSSREVCHGQFRLSQPEPYQGKMPSVPDTAYGSCYWNQAAEYCNYLSAQEGLDESQFCYEEVDNDEDYRIKPNAVELMGYRMPTDEEWEIVARAGSSTVRHFGRDSGLLPRFCFGNDNGAIRAYERGLLLPNSWGFFDTLGNVSEWIHEAIPDGPRGLAYRVRGGSCWTATSGIRSAARYYVEWQHTNKRLGFRVARTLPPSDNRSD